MKTLRSTILLAFGASLVAGVAVAQNLDQVIEKHPAVKARNGAATPATAPAAQPVSDARARNIFYDPGTAPAPVAAQQFIPLTAHPPAPAAVLAVPAPAPTPGYIGLKYKILLQNDRDGQIREVPETFPFRTGMRFRLLFEPNISGYLYIFSKGSNSKGARLFPDPRINGGNNLVEKYQEIMIPYSGWFRFDPPAGFEELYIFVTPQKLDTFDNLQYGASGVLPEGGWQQVTAATSDYQAPRPDAARAITGNKAAEGAAAKDGQKNIVYEPPAAPIVYTPPVVEPDNWDVNVPASSYVVESAPMLIHHIRLVHNP